MLNNRGTVLEQRNFMLSDQIAFTVQNFEEIFFVSLKHLTTFVDHITTTIQTPLRLLR